MIAVPSAHSKADLVPFCTVSSTGLKFCPTKVVAAIPNATVDHPEQAVDLSEVIPTAAIGYQPQSIE